MGLWSAECGAMMEEEGLGGMETGNGVLGEDVGDGRV